MSEKFSCKHGTPGAEKVGDDSQSETYTEITMKMEKKIEIFKLRLINFSMLSSRCFLKVQIA